MITINNAQIARLEKAAQSPFCSSTVEQMYQAISAQGVDVDDFILAVELQNNLLGSFVIFHDAMTAAGRKPVSILKIASANAGLALAKMTRVNPMPSNDFAAAVRDDLVAQFWHWLSNYIAIKPLPRPSHNPTHEGNDTFN
jgi:hypothetical protein